MPKNSVATKADLDNLEKKIDKKLDKLQTRVDGVDQKLDKLQITLDGFVGVVDDLRTENIVGANQFRDHEKRISKLEKTVQSA